MSARAQVGIGTPTPDAKAALDIRAADKGLLIPRLTASQRTAITGPPQGLMVYQTDGTAGGGPQTGFWYYVGTGGWVFLDAAASSGFTLPYSGAASSAGTTFAVANTGTGGALSGTSASNLLASPAVLGNNTATGNTATGVLGTTGAGYGVRGTASASGGYGVSGTATDSRGVNGFSSSGAGLYGGSNAGVAVQGVKNNGDKGRVAQFTSADAANDSTAAYVSTAGARPALRAVNSNASAQAAIRGVKTAGTDGIGVEGVVTSGGGNAAGVLGNDQSGSGSGVIGLTTGGYGVRGIASASGGYGVSGSATSSYGVIGSSTSGSGVFGSSQANTSSVAGVLGVGNGGGAAVGVLGTTTNGYGVRGVASANGGYGVQGIGTDSYGVTGTSSSGVGTYGVSTSSAGVQGYSTSSYGVQGTTAASAGNGAGVFGSSTNSNGGVGVLGTSTTSVGVRGVASGSSGIGTEGSASGTSGRAFNGIASGAADGLVVQTYGTGRAGYFSQTNSSNTNPVLQLFHQSAGATLVLSSSGVINGVAPAAGAIQFTNPNSSSPYAQIQSFGAPFLGPLLSLEVDNGAGGFTQMLYVANNLGRLQKSWGVENNLSVGGNLSVTGTLSKGGGSFKIDHPLDPENQYLYHSFVESPDMLNVYNGNVTLDASGEATVALPDYFEALNRDFRYQLTPIGAAFTPYVLAKVKNNQFRIAGQPGAEVSWQVTGIRHDKWADENRIPNATPKEPENRGKYLHPAAFGLPAARGIGHLEPGAGVGVARRH